MRKMIILQVICLFQLLAFSADAVDYIPPGTKIPAMGVSLVIPNEEGWFIFDPDGKGGVLSKAGQTNRETYVILLTHHKLQKVETIDEFIKLVKQQNDDPSRYKVLQHDEHPDKTRQSSAVSYYTLSEDHGAHQLKKGEDFMYLECMGFVASHPDDPTHGIRIEYSYRYFPNHRDPDFRRKAAAVLDGVTFDITPKNTQPISGSQTAH